MCDDVSHLAVSDMDNRRACLGYDTDVCDPLGSVLGSGRVPARVLRRRCRSEGVDRSPYEDANRHLHSADSNVRYNRSLANKSFFTLNSVDRFHHECMLPAAENGDYLMAHDQRRNGYQAGRTKFHSPTRPIVTYANVDDSRLPKVEELFEKSDQDMMEVAITKQPLKPILNYSLHKSPPQSILKKPKPKVYQDSKANFDGRRRQRAASESDNAYCTFHMVSPIAGYDSRITYVSNSNTKRAKDNTGSGYSYGAAIASLPHPTSSILKNSSMHGRGHKSKEQIIVTPKDVLPPDMHLLRTTAIDSCHVIDVSRQDSQVPTCPAVSPSLPVSSVTNMTPVKKPVKTTAKKKTKAKLKPVQEKPAKTNLIREEPLREVERRGTAAKDVHVNACSRGRLHRGSEERPIESDSKMSQNSASPTPSPDRLNSWQMDTDALITELRDAAPHETKEEHPELTSATKLAPTMNGSSVAIKSVSKDKIKDNVFLAALHTTNPFKSLPLTHSPLNLPESMSTCLRSSLFPRVPPYLRFIGHEESPSLKVPLAIQKHLKWKITTITPIVVKKTLTNSGFRLVKSECDTAECPQDETVEWIGIWGKHMKSLMFRAIKDGQKMNHFPGTFQIGRKDRLWRNLQKLCSKYGSKEFGIMPKTYVLPHDMKLLKHDWDKHFENNEKWIIKPPASARGTGIKVVSKWTQIPKKRPVVVQRYVSKPYLINGNKFDMRLYVLVTSVHPLRIYLYKDGLARFASVKYNDEVSTLNDRYMHLTNYSINRLSKNYTPNEDFAACEGHKWTLQTLFQYLRSEKKIDTKALWESLKDLVIKTIISGEASISSLTKANVTSRYNCYELFGIDVLLDEDLKPWLLEVNISPSLHSASPLDIHVKGPLVTTVLNIAQFQVPVKTNLESLCKDKPNRYTGLPYDSRLYTVYLSKEERDKHIIYTNMDDREMYLRDILSTLTPDDVRHLIQAEDELTQTGDMERIFPGRDTHKYLGYLNGPRYYNRLFDAWESKYKDCRMTGIDLLRNLCDIGYHLEVPPVPLKNDVDAPSPAASDPSLVSMEQRADGPRLGDGPAPPAPPPPAPAPA